MPRETLEKRYSGEALLPVVATNSKASIKAENAVREIALKSQNDEVTQSVTLHNTGDNPVELQLEYPLFGATEAKLSKNTLAPGQSATLDLRLKWRTILLGQQQNVLVSLKTSDPIVPRLQIAFRLTILNLGQN